MARREGVCGAAIQRPYHDRGKEGRKGGPPLKLISFLALTVYEQVTGLLLSAGIKPLLVNYKTGINNTGDGTPGD